MNTQTIGGVEYQIGKLGPFEQFHVGRKLAPLLAHVLPVLLEMGDVTEKPDFETLIFSAAAVPIADVLCKMSKEDVEFVINECLSVCQRKQPRGWANVVSNGVLMFQDIEADTMISLTQAVVGVSLGRFFPTGQPQSPPATAE